MLQLSFSSRKSNLECGAQGDIDKLNSEKFLFQYQLETVETEMNFTNASINHQLEVSQSNCSERREL